MFKRYLSTICICFVGVVLVLATTKFFIKQTISKAQTNQPIQRQININKSSVNYLVPNTVLKFYPPLDNALERVTKKPFGIKILPVDSPVQPERFSGYHTGVDFEIFSSEKTKDILISAICHGPVLLKKWSSGYGGILVQSCFWDNQKITVIYGHLKLSSIVVKVGEQLSAQTVIGVLGKGYSSETDNERKHLHLGIHKGSDINIRGYVKNQNELNNWINALSYLVNK